MKYKLMGLFLLMSVSTFASADADAERMALAKITHELDALQPLLLEARSQANSDARVSFQYDWLSLDISRIKLGIQEHLSAPRTQPRSFPPLKGDYRH